VAPNPSFGIDPNVCSGRNPVAVGVHAPDGTGADPNRMLFASR